MSYYIETPDFGKLEWTWTRTGRGALAAYALPGGRVASKTVLDRFYMNRYGYTGRQIGEETSDKFSAVDEGAA